MTNNERKARPIVPAVIVNNENGKRRKAYAIQDSGSDRDVVSPKIVREMNLKTGWEVSTVGTLNGKNHGPRENASFTVESLDGEYICEIHEALVGDLPLTENDIPPAKRDLSAYSHLNDLEYDDFDADIEILMCVAHAPSMYGPEMRIGKTNEPIAIKTPLGWTVAGIVGKGDCNESILAFVSVEKEKLKDQLDELIQRDFIVGDTAISKEQADAQKQLKDSVFFNIEKGMYGCALPFRGGREEAVKKINSHNSRGMGARRLESLRKSLERDPDKKKAVFAEVDKYMLQGKMEVVTDDDGDDANATETRWTCPLHFVWQKGKYRLVHDCAACVDGFCLNDVLLGIMEYLTPMKRPLRNFRKHLYVMTYDIVGYFYRVLLHDWDRNAFRSWWFADETMKTKILLRTTSMTFGPSSSPNICNFILRYHAEVVRPDFGDRIADAIRDDFYVDDGIGGEDYVEAYRKFKEHMTEAMRRGGFHLDKWCFSHPELAGEPEPPEGEEIKNVLGLVWNTKDDTISVRINLDDYKEVTTMRQLVSIGHKMFDHEGFLIPDGVDIRRTIQIGMIPLDWAWDKRLCQEAIDRHAKWWARRKEMSMIKIPRCWNTKETVGIIPDLHIFCDANPEKYGVVAYRRVVGRDGVVVVSFVTAKGHVVPLITKKRKNQKKFADANGAMPTLELVAARKTLDVYKEATDLKVEQYAQTVFWSDSTTVLKWIFKPWEVKNDFCGNRIRQIQQETDPEQWRYVPRDVNPADIITKGFPEGNPDKIREFHEGPEFLKQPEEMWPEMIVDRYPKRPDAIICISSMGPFLPTRREGILWLADMRGEWQEKKEFVAKMLWMKKKWLPERFQKEKISDKKSIQTADLKEAEREILKAIQEKAFKKEKEEIIQKNIRTPTATNEIKKQSRIAKFNPFMGTDGLIRVGSRLVHADINEQQKFPIILPDDSDHVRALIKKIHIEECHAGANQTHNSVRQKYWVIKGPVTTKKVVRRCPTCQKATKAPEKQKMAPLPLARVDGGRAFRVTGVDMIGPFEVRKSGVRAHHKIYIALFACFSSRAIHLEMVDKMDSDSFMNALIRFSGRRPGLEKLVSDNGTNFVGAKNIIAKETNEVREIDKQTRREVQELSAKFHNGFRKVSTAQMILIKEGARADLLERGLEWEFLPPYASHYAGVWERLVGLTKKHLAKMLPNEAVHHDTFHTIITEIESTLNRRPLTSVSTDPRDATALTPESLLAPYLGQFKSAEVAPETPLSKADELRFRFKQARSCVDAFWKRWRSDYINTLTNRSKWTRTATNIAVDDVVMIVDDSVKRKRWLLGRVVAVDHAEEHVRKIDIRRADGSIITRDRTGVVKLETEGEGGWEEGRK